MKTLIEIRSEILQRIKEVKVLKGIHEKVKVQLDGKLAIITGQFRDREQKSALLDIVTSYPELKVLCDASVDMDMTESDSDKGLRDQIQKSLGEGLRYYSDVSVKVSAGRVFLDGRVAHEKDRQIIYALIEQITGVKSIFNNLTFPCEYTRAKQDIA